MVKATQRLGADAFQWFWVCLRRRVPKRLRPLWTWCGWTVMAVDGSRVEAPRARGNQRGLGRAGREKTGPQWWVTWLIHLPSGLIWDWRQGPGTSSERTHRRRSKRARDWPHKKKDPLPQPPNLRTPTRRENAFIQAVELYYALRLA